MREVFHNTVAKGFKNYLCVNSTNVNFIVDRKRYEYKINDITFKLQKRFTVIDYLKSLYSIAFVNLDNIVDCKNKTVLEAMQPKAKELYKELGFSYSTFTLFKNSITIIPLS